MAIQQLPEHLLMEILCRLPVKSLLRSKPVCKYWYSLLLTPSFIYLHHDHAASIAADANTDCLLVKRFLDGGVVLFFVPNGTPIEDIDISSTGLNIKQLQILGPCYGVVCLTRFALNSTIVIWNPSMKEFSVLPQPSYNNDHISNLGFGYDPFTDDYKVVRFDMTGLPIGRIDEKIEIYELRTDSWREVDAESPIESGLHCLYDSYASWNGDCFWYAYPPLGYHHHGGPVIMAFSMSDEVFEELPVPEVCLLDDDSEMRLFVLNDSLAMGLDLALGFRQNGEFLVESSYGQMMSYNLNTRERKEYEVHDQLEVHPRPPHIQVLPYVESLVSVKRQQ
ncbi:putative F-box protein At3g16210 [Rhododendron vialii]|uniref:putative F-box protein At3g16210 n=1 Tax=Rhododendron vialii TaxID=182163 RepID=UPI00265F2E6F|nr:putative F-box protein At3g16210 [Rhododendron vialii]